MSDVRIFTRHIHEHVVAGKRLGRHYRYDSRSAAYPFAAPFVRYQVTPQLWRRFIPILNQGNYGSCTGNAGTGALGTDPVFTGMPITHPVLEDRKSTRLNSSHSQTSYAVFCLK